MDAGNPFADLGAFVRIPRLDELVLSPDGRRLVATVQTPSPDGKRWLTALWAIDPDGKEPALRLTRSAEGEGTPAFLPDGDLLFVSRRADPDVDDPDDDVTSLWLLPARGGEARTVLSRAGGFQAVVTARDADAVVFAADVTRGAAEDDDARRKARKDAGVTAILHEDDVVRRWDTELGPGDLRLLVTAPEGEGLRAPRDVTPDGERHLAYLTDTRFAVTPDATAAVVTWEVAADDGGKRVELVAIDLATGERRVVAADPHADFEAPAVSPDGRWVACVRIGHGSVGVVADTRLWLVALDGGEGRPLAPDLDLWPHDPVWAPDSTAVFFVADQNGHAPAFRVDVASGAVTRLTAAGATASLQPAPGGDALYALWSRVDAPPVPVRLSPVAADQEPVVLPAPAVIPRGVHGRVEEVTTTAADGTPLRAWLALPEDTSGPAPLLVFIHGGPHGSWNGWQWRWCPWVATARGYAVLLPDPALSTGYGQHMIERGWGQWGGTPFDDVMALTDAALERADLDADRTAALGGSYGGYLANWTASHTDRFRAIVTHASLWALDRFAATTDAPWWWRRQWGDPEDAAERYSRWSPHRYIADIHTPMLVIHGDKDYRVPIGEALHLWTDLKRVGVDAKFLSFATENHWILTPGNARVWYETKLAFCDHHVLGKPWERPSLL